MVAKRNDRANEDDYEFYRGMKFEFRANGDVFWRSPKEQNIYIQVKKGLDKIVKKLLKLRPSGGTFRITESREVLLKLQDSEHLIEGIHVGINSHQFAGTYHEGNNANQVKDSRDLTRFEFIISVMKKLKIL